MRLHCNHHKADQHKTHNFSWLAGSRHFESDHQSSVMLGSYAATGAKQLQQVHKVVCLLRDSRQSLTQQACSISWLAAACHIHADSRSNTAACQLSLQLPITYLTGSPFLANCRSGHSVASQHVLVTCHRQKHAVSGEAQQGKQTTTARKLVHNQHSDHKQQRSWHSFQVVDSRRPQLQQQQQIQQRQHQRQHHCMRQQQEQASHGWQVNATRPDLWPHSMPSHTDTNVLYSASPKKHCQGNQYTLHAARLLGTSQSARSHCFWHQELPSVHSASFHTASTQLGTSNAKQQPVLADTVTNTRGPGLSVVDQLSDVGYTRSQLSKSKQPEWQVGL